MALLIVQLALKAINILHSALSNGASGRFPGDLVGDDLKVGPWAFSIYVLLGIVFLDQIVYQIKKKNLPGPVFKIPIIGSFLDSKNPTFQSYLSKWESGALSCVSVFHKFIVIASTNDLSRKILSSSQFTQPALIDAGKKILLPSNWVFLNGKAHTEYRKGLNHLFTQRALSTYLPTQEQVYRKTFKEWMRISEDGVKEFMIPFRDFMVEVSCRSFCGDYLSDAQILKVAELYWDITAAMELVNFPVAFPGTNLYRGIQARKYAMNVFIEAAKKSRANLLNGGKVSCMMDEWIDEMIKAEQHKNGETSEKPTVMIRDFSDFEISQVFLSFLFASQDATSSAMCWLFQFLADYPEVFKKVREEQIAVRDGDLNKPVDYPMVEKMIYTRAVVKESLRMRPPVLMVPYSTKKAFPITKDYTVPKDSMIIPTFWHSLYDEKAYPEPYKFNPDRWLPSGDAEQHKKNWMVFGVGQHLCIGQQYAQMHLMVSAGMATLHMNWIHDKTKRSDEQMIFATTFPMDKCRLRFTPGPLYMGKQQNVEIAAL